MRLQDPQIPDLGPHEIRPQHLPRMGPRRAIRREDARPQQRGEPRDPPAAQTPLLVVGGLDALEVLGLDGEVDVAAEVDHAEGVGGGGVAALLGEAEDAASRMAATLARKRAQPKTWSEKPAIQGAGRVPLVRRRVRRAAPVVRWK
ncbi:hypothetical protein Tdes44962_MAKER08159 [Teratosphaeria destructans]|uniref:Uncharacterized protein n=1 Tax=Teratosphaeria destructans TaxID=418781 RepID=A0A9W7SX91_9PEZI|nr:hypothetical protein Tdes44962_MAKER08159 [Teratosphaeria destructans]